MHIGFAQGADGCKIYMNSYMGSNGSCSMVTWTIFKSHLLEVGLTQNWEIMVLRTLITIHLIHSIMCEHPAWIEIHWNSKLVEGPITHDFALHLRTYDHATWFWKWLGTSFGPSRFHGHNSWVMWPYTRAPKTIKVNGYMHNMDLRIISH